MKKILIIFMILMLCSCELEESQNKPQQNTTQEAEHKGKCLEYKTEYKLDCGFFTCGDSLCCERKYDVCVRWEE